MTNTIITTAWDRQAYALTAFMGMNPTTKPVDSLSGPDAVKLFNLMAEIMGTSRVKRFADTKTATRRVWAQLEAYAAWLERDDDFEASDEELAQQKGRSNTVTVETAGGPTQVDLSKLAVDPSGNPGGIKPSEQLLKAAAAAKKEPTTGGRGNIWRRAKHENPSKVAYRPEEGTVQGQLYKLLTREGGITMEDYCAEAQKIKTKDATLFTPSAVWGALRYLFVTNRGYGLDFDGEKLQLLVPADERQSSRKIKREG